MTTMKALRFENDRLNLAEIARPEKEGEALVRVLMSGICNTDLEIVRGYAGFQGTIGHEFVGVVEECADKPELIGKRVVGEINAGCGVCKDCKKGDSRHCPNRTVLGIVGRDGAHAEFLTLPARNLLEVAEEISDKQAVFIEPLAAAVGILERAHVPRDARVAVIGDGKLGILCAQALALRSQNTFLVGKHEEKMRIARNRGVETVLLQNAEKLNGSFDFVIEASGAESGFQIAVDLLKPLGTLVLKSTFHGEPKWQAARVVVDEITIVGSRCGRFAPALELLKEKKVDVENMISEEFRLENGVSAMERATERGVLKVLLRP